MSEFGIDVSHYQGKIDWEKVVKSGRGFVIMKAMYEKAPHNKDETFEYNYKNAGAVGMERGVYIYIGSSSINDPVGDAKALLNHLNGRELEYGIWLDLESDKLRAKGKEFIRNLCYVYAYHFSKQHYMCGIYCNRDWYLNVIPEDLKKDFVFWIARYPANDNGTYNPDSSIRPSSDYAVAWQYSSKGSVPGIQGKVDLDIDYEIDTYKPYRDIDEIALEVINGKWGNVDSVPSRKVRLEKAGYNYFEVQKKVNEVLKNRS